VLGTDLNTSNAYNRLIRKQKSIIEAQMGKRSENSEQPVRIRGFAPLVGRDPHALILGSMPSEKSLEEDKYYAHPRNRFWSLMNWLLAGDNTRPAYKDGIEILSSHGIALWDSVGSCLREGSLDSEIREIEPNPVDKVLKENPGIRFVFFNGKKSESVFRQIFRQLIAERADIGFISLPSTSPANAAWNFERLSSAWGTAFLKAGIPLAAEAAAELKDNK